MTRKQQIVEQQVAQWRARMAREPDSPDGSAPTIAIDADLGTRGPEVARLTADMLGVALYEHEIVAKMAELGHVHEAAVEVLDEMGQSHIEDLILGLFNEHNFGRDDYLATLERAVASLTTRPCVLLGHGAVHVIDRSRSLAVHVASTEDARLRWVTEHDQLSIDRAERRLRASDRDHARFHEAYFEPPVVGETYDLVVDSSHLGVYGSAGLIVSAFASKVAVTQQAAPARSGPLRSPPAATR